MSATSEGTSAAGLSVYEPPPNTQGFTAPQILNLLEGYDVAASGDGTSLLAPYGRGGEDRICRPREMADGPNFVDIPVQRLIARRMPMSGGA